MTYLGVLRKLSVIAQRDRLESFAFIQLFFWLKKWLIILTISSTGFIAKLEGMLIVETEWPNNCETINPYKLQELPQLYLDALTGI